MNILGVQIMDGPVTIGLVSVCFAVAMVVVGIFAYFVNRFQTKEDAHKLEESALLREKDMKDWIRKVESDVSKMQTSLERIGENVSYIRGRLDPTKSKED